MKGLILAAGNGGRLRPLTLETPKVLLEIDGKPMINWPINAMLLAGVDEIAVVVGHNSEKVEVVLKQLYPEIRFIFNENHSKGNALSIGVAQDFMENGPFVMCMGDHPISPVIIKDILLHSCEWNILSVDYGASLPAQLNDATRVFVGDDGYIDNIGKDLETWNAIDTGVFKMTSNVFSTINSLTDQQCMGLEISDLVNYMSTIGQPFAACDVKGAFWSDVDTLDDYMAIKAMMN